MRTLRRLMTGVGKCLSRVKKMLNSEVGTISTNILGERGESGTQIELSVDAEWWFNTSRWFMLWGFVMQFADSCVIVGCQTRRRESRTRLAKTTVTSVLNCST